MKRSISLLLIAALAGACARKADDASRQVSPEEARAAAPPVGGLTTEKSDKDAKRAIEPTRPADLRKVIRTGRVDLVVATYDDARTRLDALIKSAGGYIDSTQVERAQTAVSSAVLVVRIPSDAFESVIPKLRELGDVTSEATNAADVTDQYVDMTARLASAQVLEKRLLELATARDGKVDQLLAVERELARVRGEIESYQGHLNQWNDQIALSTLTITMSTRKAEIAAAAAPTLRSRTSNAFQSSIEALCDFGSWIVINGIALLPWLLILVPGGVLLRRFARRVFRRRLPVAVAVAVTTERS
jgi:hypothetical protein